MKEKLFRLLFLFLALIGGLAAIITVNSPEEVFGQTSCPAIPSFGAIPRNRCWKEKKKRDGHGNWFRYRAKAYDSRGEQLGRWAWDVFLTGSGQ